MNAEIFTLANNIRILCLKANKFPDGVQEAFEKLENLIPYSENRQLFGISCPDKSGEITYKAAAEELDMGEAEKYSCESFTIKKGNYISIYIKDYLTDKSSIGRAFRLLLSNPDIDPLGYCLEIYENHTDVRCLVPLKS